MKRLPIYFLGLLTILSCQSKSDIHITKEFLQGEWMMDSIVGKTDWKQDWIYFTDDNKYWRFSKYSESYLIEKEFDWQVDNIYNGDELTYTITLLDSGNIILDNGVEKFHCKRWMPFDREDIDQFLQADPIKRRINGNWTLDSATFFPVKIPSFCEKLDKGTGIYFHPSGTVQVHPLDTAGNKYCDTYDYSIYVSDKNELSLRENDMVMSYTIDKLDSNVLILTSQYRPTTIKLSRKNWR